MTDIDVSMSVVPEYEKELTETQEAVVTAVLKDLKDCKVEDELVKARVLAQHKSFALKCYIAGVNARIDTPVEAETEADE